MKLLSFTLLLCSLGNCCLAEEPKTEPSPQLHKVVVEQAGRKIAITLIVFTDKNFAIHVIDNADANAPSKFLNLASAMESNGCIAGSNGGFFNRKPFDPVGGMISNNQRISAVDPTTWTKGLLVVRAGHPTLESSESFQDTPDVTDLLQSGIWLVRAGKSESDANQTKAARRTFVCHDSKGTWAMGVSERCTFYELATILKSPEVTTILDVQEALNFDGGPI